MHGEIEVQDMMDTEHFAKAIEIITRAFEFCEQSELNHTEVHTAFLFLTLGSIYETLEDAEIASSFVNTIKHLAEVSYKISMNEDVPDDIKIIVDKFADTYLSVYLNEFKTIH